MIFTLSSRRRRARTHRGMVLALLLAGLAVPRRARGEEPAQRVPPGQGQRWDDERVPARKLPPREASDSEVCIVGQPRPLCSTIVLLELGGRFGSDDWYGTADLGLLMNWGQSRALGVTLGVLEPIAERTDTGAEAVALKVRYRHWIGTADANVLGGSIDLNVGVTKISGPGSIRANGMVLEVAAQAGDAVALTAALQTWPNSNAEMEVSAAVGLRLGLGFLQYPLRAIWWLAEARRCGGDPDIPCL